MALTNDDITAIKDALKPSFTGISQEISGLRQEMNTRFTEQNQLNARSFEDLKEVMQHTYVNREEFEELKSKVDELQIELDQLKKARSSSL